MRKFLSLTAAIVLFSAGAITSQIAITFETETELASGKTFPALNGHAYVSLKENEKKVLIMGYLNGCAGAYAHIHNRVWTGATGMFLKSVEDRKRAYNEKVERIRRGNAYLLSQSPSTDPEQLMRGGSVMDGGVMRFIGEEPLPEAMLPDQFAGCEHIVELISTALYQGYDASFPTLTPNDICSRLNRFYQDAAQRSTPIMQAMAELAR